MNDSYWVCIRSSSNEPSRKNGGGSYWFSSIFILLILVTGGIANAGDGPALSASESIAVLQAAQAQQNTPSSGSGIAATEEDSNGEKEHLHVTFEFDGASSRSELLEQTPAPNETLLVKWIDTPDRSFLFSGTSARIQKPGFPCNQYRRVGEDFHPDAFQTIRGNRVQKILANIVKAMPEGNLKCDGVRTQQGTVLITVSYQFKEPDKLSRISMEFDPRLNLRLVSWEAEQRNVNGPNSWEFFHYNLTWAKYGDEYYPSEADIRQEDNDGKYFCKTVVIRFNPNQKIDKRDFAIESFHMPLGTRIMDSIGGLDYPYGGRPVKGQIKEAN